jgi:hypothetical protein
MSLQEKTMDGEKAIDYMEDGVNETQIDKALEKRYTKPVPKEKEDKR